MDCDKFDSVLMDLLYEELDELTRASAQRHTDQCQRCREVLARFRATRETTRMPMVEPPDGFESRVLEAERAARKELPFRERLVRALTIASGYAMRPQLAMAALLLLVVGASLAVLRPKPGSHGSVQVTEHGAPQNERELVVPVDEPPKEVTIAPERAPVVEEEPVPTKTEATTAPALAARSAEPADVEAEDQARAAAEDRAYAAAMDAYRSGDHDAAQRQFDAIVQSGGRNASAAELYAAFATERVAGCAAALPRFDSVSAKNESNDLGHQATWQSATCRVQLGQDARARRDLEQLLHVPAYSGRARQALAQLGVDQRDPSLVALSEGKDAPLADDAKAAGAPRAASGAQPVAEAKQSASNTHAPDGQSPAGQGAASGAKTARAAAPPAARPSPARGEAPATKRSAAAVPKAKAAKPKAKKPARRKTAPPQAVETQ